MRPSPVWLSVGLDIEPEGGGPGLAAAAVHRDVDQVAAGNPEVRNVELVADAETDDDVRLLGLSDSPVMVRYRAFVAAPQNLTLTGTAAASRSVKAPNSTGSPSTYAESTWHVGLTLGQNS